jgi:hypothetical protein
MSAIRRTAVLIGLTLAVIVVGSIPASATFADSVQPVTATVTTPSVTAPTSVSVVATCSGGRLKAVVTWPATNAPRVSYDVTASIPLAGLSLGGHVTENRFVHEMGQLYASHTASVTITITPKTPYGWTAPRPAQLTTSVTTC